MTIVWRTLPAGGGGVSISGTPNVGQTLHCTAPTGATLQWHRDTNAIGGATSADYVVSSLDQGHDLTCAATISSNALTVPGAPLTVAFFGDSFAGSVTDGITSLSQNFAAVATSQIGADEVNYAVGGARNVLNTSQIGTQVYQKDGVLTLPASAPYAPIFPVCVLQASINNLTLSSMVATPSLVGSLIVRGVKHLRAGGVYEATGARWSCPSWSNIATRDANSGPGVMRTTANGQVATLTTPSDFPGGKLRVYGPKLQGFGATFTFTLDGSGAGTLNVADTPADGNSYGSIVWEKEFTGLAAGAHTVTVTSSSLSGAANVNGADFEAGTTPLVVVMGASRAPAYPGGEHNPVDVDVTAMNTAVQSALTTAFPSDPNVLYFDMDAVLAPGGTPTTSYFGPDQIHPNVSGHSAVGSALATAISNAL